MDKQEITSKDNEKIKHLKKLGAKKYREEFGEFLVENFTIIKDATLAGVKPLAIFATSEFVEKNELELEGIILDTKVESYFEIDNKINKQFSNLKNPSGICAVYEIKEGRKLETDKHIVYLNSIGDPGNLGTILRSAIAFDLKTIVLDETCADPYNYKSINSAKDAIFKVDIIFDENLEILKKIKKEMKIVSTKMDGDKDISKLDSKKPFCIVLGDESRGVDDDITKLSDEFVKIKISKDIESLNVASAGAIIFYSIYSTK
jgi:RNA methyltransferase, TrmH family